MFEGFHGFWTPVAWAAELGARPIPVTVAGQPIALFRGADGGVGALVDRCPHRGVRLSLGRVTPAGCLECPFHGWAFDRSGACTHVPLNDVPEARRATLGVVALPVREVAGMIWIFTGAEARGEPDVPEMLGRPGITTKYLAETWSTHWTRAMENMLDSPHLPYAHRSSIGASLRRAMERGARITFEVEETDHGFRQETRVDGASSGAWIEWHRPNAMVLHIPIPGMAMRQHMWCVPVDGDHVRMMLVTTREMSPWNLLNLVFGWTERRVILEDRPIVESSRPARVPDPREERSVPTDRATLLFRRWVRTDPGTREGAVAPG